MTEYKANIHKYVKNHVFCKVIYFTIVHSIAAFYSNTQNSYVPQLMDNQVVSADFFKKQFY